MFTVASVSPPKWGHGDCCARPRFQEFVRLKMKAGTHTATSTRLIVVRVPAGPDEKSPVFMLKSEVRS